MMTAGEISCSAWWARIRQEGLRVPCGRPSLTSNLFVAQCFADSTVMTHEHARVHECSPVVLAVDVETKRLRPVPWVIDVLASEGFGSPNLHAWPDRPLASWADNADAILVGPPFDLDARAEFASSRAEWSYWTALRILDVGRETMHIGAVAAHHVQLVENPVNSLPSVLSFVEERWGQVTPAGEAV